MNEYTLPKNIKITDAYGESYLNFNIKGMEKRAKKVGFNLFNALITRVDSQEDIKDKRIAMNNILTDIYNLEHPIKTRRCKWCNEPLRFEDDLVCGYHYFED